MNPETIFEMGTKWVAEDDYQLLQAENDALRRENESLKLQNQRWNGWVGELQARIRDLEFGDIDDWE